MTKTITINLRKKISAADYYGGNKHSARDNLKHDAQAVWSGSGHYKYLGAVNEQHIINRYVKTTRTKGGQIIPGDTIVIKLGGPFEEVGGNNEAVGGDNEKVG